MSQDQTQDNTPVFMIEKLYLKDASLELPNAPQGFLQRETPEISVQMGNDSTPLENGLFQTTVTVTVTASVQEKTLFLVEVVQAGIFRIMHIPAQDMPFLLNVTCPNILFPYAREAVSDLVTRGGFPPVVLNPVSFEGLYQQRLQQAEANAVPSSELAQ